MKHHLILLFLHVSQHSFALYFSLSILPICIHNHIHKGKNMHTRIPSSLPFTHTINTCHWSAPFVYSCRSEGFVFVLPVICPFDLMDGGWWRETPATHTHTQNQWRFCMCANMLYERGTLQINVSKISTQHLGSHIHKYKCTWTHVSTQKHTRTSARKRQRLTRALIIIWYPPFQCFPSCHGWVPEWPPGLTTVYVHGGQMDSKTTREHVDLEWIWPRGGWFKPERKTLNVGNVRQGSPK